MVALGEGGEVGPLKVGNVHLLFKANFLYFTHLSAALNALPSSKSAGNMLAGAKKVKLVLSKLAMSTYFSKLMFCISLT
jgi:hypothetical protein